MNLPQIAIIGASGNVGRLVIEQLLKRKMAAPNQLRLMASKQSKGKIIDILGNHFTIEDTTEGSFENCDICIFNTESDISAYFVPHALNAGAFVIDSSSHYRLHPEVPLIIPPVNKHNINLNHKLYAHANCLASPIATVVNPLHRQFSISRLQVSTYQSASGAGKSAMDECKQQMQSALAEIPITPHYFPRQLAFNLFPQVGQFRTDGYSSEEHKIIHEVRKVIGEIPIHATAVRVPVMVGHSISVSVELAKTFDLKSIHTILSHAPSVQLSENHYTTPIEVAGENDVFVGRIRQDQFNKQWLHFWLCSDNLHRGAATDAIEIAEQILALYNQKHNAVAV